MRTCRNVDLISRMLPIRTWKGNILERHINRCPSCRAKLAIRDEARRYVIEPSALSPSDSIWTAVEVGIRKTPLAPRPRFLPARRFWVLAASAAAAVLILMFFALKPPRPVGPVPREAWVEDFRLDSVEAWGKPARALFYQARDSQITIIWVR